MPKRLRSLILLFLSGSTLTAAAAWQQATLPSRSDPVPEVRNAEPRYRKGNLHTHSLWSDGDDFPEMIADWYKRHGYDFLALTDHNILSEGERWIEKKPGLETASKKYLARFGEHWVQRRTKDGKEEIRLKPLAEFRSLLEEPGRFLMMPAEEISARYAKLPVHLNAINLRDRIPPANGGSVAETIQANIRAVNDQRKRTGWRTITILNHPNFGWGVKAEDMLVEELRFFEVYNGHPTVYNLGDKIHPGTERLWDIILAQRLGKHKLPIVYGLATDDSHAYHNMAVGKANPGRGWIMVKSRHLTAESILEAMEAGDFYASSGVRLEDVRRVGNQFSLKIAAEKGVTYRTQFIATLKGVSLDSAPRLDEEGKVLDVTRVYHPEVGKVVAESSALEPTYRLTGNELYVRAKVISSKIHPNPSAKGEFENAWTQPIVP